ncbi:hypothetical protein [Pseudonocardia spinosispora]|uniref:hypothetical protein n=1 Tax=Pseudonocardia spinosispora TaxID=103441 RepID=UPI000412751A|nr:hypothetical protein [Pseudonocardia spinosispora]
MYRVIPDDAVHAQVNVLPGSALIHYAEALAALEVAPLSLGRPYNENRPDAPMRELIFGPAGEGAITYLVMERDREVHLLVVQWL